MIADDDFHNIVPALVSTAQAALHLRAAAAGSAAAALAALAQQVLDATVRFAAAVVEADTFEDLDAAYHAHYPALGELFTHLAGQMVPAAAQAAYTALQTVWAQTAQTEIFYHCDLDQLLGAEDQDSAATGAR